MPKVSAKIIPHSPILLVGEAPGVQEEINQTPFSGGLGSLLADLGHRVGLVYTQCSAAFVVPYRPLNNDVNSFFAKKKTERTIDHKEYYEKWALPVVFEGIEDLKKVILEVQPQVILAFGEIALWALTHNSSIGNWRGSYLSLASEFQHSCIVIPTYSLRAVQTNYEWHAPVCQDIRRAVRAVSQPPVPPKATKIIFPSFEQVLSIIRNLYERLQTEETTLSVDIETIRHHTACVGIAWSKTEAICIPIFTRKNYWSLDQETEIILALRQLLIHPNARVIGQNFLYDTQYFFRYHFFIPNFARDTMFQHHVCFPGTPKTLDYLSSLYCEYHVYWKDDLKDYKTAPTDDAKFFLYNCEDTLRTYEIDEVEQRAVAAYQLQDQADFQHEMFYNCLDAMIRGVAVDLERRADLNQVLSDEMLKREQLFVDYLGHPLNPRSPKKMQELFYYDFGIKPVISRKTHMPTVDDDALTTIGKREPLLLPLILAIKEFRSLGVFRSTFIEAPLDIDNRMRTSYNPAGPETFRLSSSANAFDSGTNLQNIPKGDDPDDKEPGQLVLPNVRTIFVPDPGYTFYDMDLDRADLQVVVWEADDEDLKLVLRSGIDLHCYSACDIFDIKGIPIDELKSKHPNYPEHRGRIGEVRRQKAKMGVHAVDYYCQARTLAIQLGISVVEAEHFIQRWLGAHPGIRKWHDRVRDSLVSRKAVYNKFGYRRLYFDRIDTILPEALAWIPQSTVAGVINRAWSKIRKELTPTLDIQVLLQVHDSLAGQFPTNNKAICCEKLLEASKIIVPYEDPLIIPSSIKTSDISWGDCG